MKEQREFFKTSIELCDRCNKVKDVNQFAGIVEVKDGRRFAICKTCKKDRLVNILIRHNNILGNKFIERKDV